MIFETCPLLEDIEWIKHGFYGVDNPCAHTGGLKGIQFFNDEFPRAVFLKQDHTDAILSTIDDAPTCLADAIITLEDNTALAIKTADCCPILFVCTQSKQIAVVHAGWPGALNQITGKTIDRLVSLGASPKHIIAAIGPSIQQSTYKVRNDVRDKFMSDQRQAERHFTRFEDRWKMDISGIIIDQLKEKGVKKIWRSDINTFTDRNYSSHRRAPTDPPIRNVSLIMKTGE